MSNNNSATLTIKSWNKTGTSEKYLENRGNATILVNADSETYISVDAFAGPGVFHNKLDQCRIEVRDGSEIIQFTDFKQFSQAIKIGQTSIYKVTSLEEFDQKLTFNERREMPDLMKSNLIALEDCHRMVEQIVHIATLINGVLFMNNENRVSLSDLISDHGPQEILRKNAELFILL